MNNVLFSNLIALVSTMDDKQMSTMLGYAVQITGTKSKTKAKKFEPKPDKDYDYEVDMSLKDSKTVKINKYIEKKDVWEALRNRFEPMGGKYDKDKKVIVFKTAKNAKEFVSNKVVAKAEREIIWQRWEEEKGRRLG